MHQHTSRRDAQRPALARHRPGRERTLRLQPGDRPAGPDAQATGDSTACGARSAPQCSAAAGRQRDREGGGSRRSGCGANRCGEGDLQPLRWDFRHGTLQPASAGPGLRLHHPSHRPDLHQRARGTWCGSGGGDSPRRTQFQGQGSRHRPPHRRGGGQSGGRQPSGGGSGQL